MRRAGIVGLFLLLVAGLPSVARADGYEETELRLKTAGIDEAMREEIHDAIRRAVACLKKMQFKTGNMPGTNGHTALAALALRHAAIPDAVATADKALKYLMRYGQKQLAGSTYEAGITAMLLDAADKHPKFLRRLHNNLSKGPQSNHGYWGYKTGGSPGVANLSTAQFACLGLWAAERNGVPVAAKAWRLHVEALLLAQGVDGSWSYYAANDPIHGVKMRTPRTYPTGTFMGLADLLLARQALREEWAEKPERLARIDVAIAKGHAALRRHIQWVLGSPHIAGPIGTFPFYRLYALEKVCIFADLEDVGGILWYRDGARWLLDTQQEDGGWISLGGVGRPSARTVVSQSNLLHTSFALLFLLRASAAYHPVTPRPVDTPKTAVTPRAEDKAPTTPDGPTVPPLDAAQAAVGKLERALASPRIMKLTPYRDALRLIERTYAASRNEKGAFVSRGHDVWAGRAERVLQQIATEFATRKPNDRLLWQALAFDALDVLATMHPRAGLPLMKGLLGVESGKAFRREDQLGWYGAVFDTLRRMKTPAFRVWLNARALSPEPNHWPRTATALTAIGGMADDLSGTQRYAAASAIFGKLEPVLRRSMGNQEAQHLIRDIQAAVLRLTHGRAGDGFPTMSGALGTEVPRRMERWWKQEGRERDSVYWKD